jgi:hypothetical protein
MDFLTAYTHTHHSELQVITALSLISTLHKSPQHPPRTLQLSVLTSRSLATVSNSGKSSVTRTQVLITVSISEILPIPSTQL